ncbi:MAG: CHAT domain-containing protein, partial [Candidatus Sulfomarinibacteraceae bacterium]
GVGALIPAAGGPPETRTEDTLLLSGLAMAGANQRDLPGDEDGVLTAEEIAALDLSGVEWAVLSACDSGVGEVSVREGIFGLQRAFRIAGARTVIMSLWAVDDEAAREWMAALYRAHLVEGLATAEAVRRASLDILAARRSRGASVHPSSWAPFVASGDGR